ncbi:hypothetical protein ACVWXL_004680 [Bradyrhizobium sp. GM22.5]
MKMNMGLILGSAAGLLATGGTQAADLPSKAKAIEYVKVCSLYGAGFYYIPGTDTCLKFGGYVRIDTTFNGGIYDAPAWNGSLGARDRFRDYFTGRTRGALTVDTRTSSEYGVVRTFFQGDFNFSTFNGGGGTNPALVTANAAGANVGGLLDTAGSNGWAGLEYAFVQFAGFTFGKSSSAYSTPWHSYPGNTTSFLLGGEDSVSGLPNVQYTADFGSGLSGSVGLDENRVFDRTNLSNVTLTAAGSQFTGNLGNSYGGNHAPDFVGRLRVDQAWGLAQLSAAAHNLNATYYNPVNETSGHPDDTWGFAVMGALQIKNLPTGPGDDFKIEGSYAEGATKYVIATSAGSPTFAMFGGTSAAGAYQSLAVGYTTDGVYAGSAQATGTAIQKTQSFGFRGAFNHNWNPQWSTSMFGSASWVRYPGNGNTDPLNGIVSAAGLVCNKMLSGGALTGAPLLAAASANYSCNPKFAIYQLGTVTRWTPVTNLTFSAEVLWTKLDQNMQGTVVPAAVPATLAKPAGVAYEFRDQNTMSLNVRVQRNF